MWDADIGEQLAQENRGHAQPPGLENDGSQTSVGIHVDRDLDLKGKVCPYTFVETMLALEEMEINQVLRVVVDYGPSACDVPKSLTKEGYDILDVSKINETDWAICVRNRPFEE